MSRCLRLSVHELIIEAIRTVELTVAMQTLETWILGNLQRQPILWPKLFQLCQHAISDRRNTYAISLPARFSCRSCPCSLLFAIRQSIMP